MSKLTRTALAAIAVVGVIAATGVSTAAADTVQTRSREALDPRLPVVDGPTVAGVKVTGTRGPAGGSINTWSACENYATVANESIASGLSDLYAGNSAAATEKFGEAVKTLDEGAEVGCVFA